MYKMLLVNGLTKKLYENKSYFFSRGLRVLGVKKNKETNRPHLALRGFVFFVKILNVMIRLLILLRLYGFVY